MNELAKMGFVYDVTHIAPNGQEVEHQRVHNVMMNQGLTNFLRGVFLAGQYSSTTVNRVYPQFIFGFMENNYQPVITDSTAVNALEDYGWDVRMFIGYKYAVNPFLYKSLNTLNDDGTSISTPERSITFDSYKVITGAFLLHDAYDKFHDSIPTTTTNALNYAKGCILLSAALFPTPMQVEPKGVLKVKAGFTAITA